MKTPKREHRCERCGGAIDVHLDPSCETEEYSMCRKCHMHTISHCGHTWKPYKERARWIRKNREARLKHALRKKDEIIDYAANEVQRMSNEACDEYEHQLRLRLSLASTRTLNNFQRGCINASSTYGQDVEGS